MSGDLEGNDKLRKIAEELSRLAPGRVSINSTKEYFSLDFGSSGNKNAVGIHKKYVTFLVTDQKLLKQAEEAKIDLRPFDRKKRPTDYDKFMLCGLNASMITENESLFRDLLESSISILVNRKNDKQNTTHRERQNG